MPSCNHCCSGKALNIAYSECVCSLRYPACNAHAPYCYKRPLWFHNIFPHYLINGIVLKKIVIEHKICVLISSTTFVWNISHSKKSWARYGHKHILVFMQSTGYSCQILIKLESYRQIFEKNTQELYFLKTLPLGAELLHVDGCTDGQTWM